MSRIRETRHAPKAAPRHAEVFAGVQRCAEERGWTSILDEFTHDTLRAALGAAEPSDGIVARAGPTSAAAGDRETAF